MVNVSFLVRNRLRLTWQTLNSFVETTDRDSVSVVVLDDRSDTPTREFVEDWCREQHATYIRNDVGMGTGQLRNRVIEASTAQRGEFLYASDNDLCFRPGWLGTLVGLYRRVSPEFAILGAYNHPFHQPVASTGPLDHTGHAVHEILALATQSMLMSWETWDRFGPFVPTPVDRVCQSEDVDFSNRIRAAGLRVGVVAPALVIATSITNTFGEHIPGWQAVAAQIPKGVICE